VQKNKPFYFPETQHGCLVKVQLNTAKYRNCTNLRLEDGGGILDRNGILVNDVHRSLRVIIKLQK